MSLEVGQIIEGKYRITGLIGEGGMGSVFAGENVRINRRVAIKVLHAAFTGNTDVMQRFEREAQAAGRIGNDHILEVLDLGSLPNGDHFIVMEFLEGEPLSKRVERKGRLTERELYPIARQLLVGLGAAHRAGIVHRDLKPDNVFLLREKATIPDFVKIIDFGISKFQPLAGDGMKMTRTGAVMGTPYYMSPEQASGSAEADQRSDLYAVGVILFEALTGRVPFEGETFNQLMFKIVLEEPPALLSLRPDADPAFASLVAKAMARDANHRFQSADDFILALDEWLQRGTSVSFPPPANAAQAGLLPARTGGTFVSPHRTAGNWATSQPGVEESAPKKKAPVLAGALIAAAVAAGAAFGAVKFFGARAAVDAAAATQAPSAALPVVSTPEPAREITPPVVASEAPAPPALPSAVASAPSGTVELPAASASSVAAPAPPSTSKPRVATSKPVKPSSKPAKPKPTSTTPDFGY